MSYFSNIDYSYSLQQQMNYLGGRSDNANNNADYCRYQIDHVGTVSINFFGIDVGDPPSALNKRIKEAKELAATAEASAGTALLGVGANSTAITGLITTVGELVTGLATVAGDVLPTPLLCILYINT